MIDESLREYAGLPVEDFDDTGRFGPLPEPDAVAWRIGRITTADGFLLSETLESLDVFLEAVDTTRVTHLILGWWGAHDWGEVRDPVRRLVEAAGRLPGLRALFFGEIAYYERELSWIEQFDVTPLLEAFPLERLDVRGGDGLRIGPLRHERLRTLRIESAGLSAGTVEGIVACDLPELERLTLWLGDPGASPLPALAPVLEETRFPALRHLGLCNSPEADAFAGALASAPVVAGLASLDLSMGALTDAGAEALLSGQPLGHLHRLDLHHHFLTEPAMERLRAGLPGVDVDLTDRQDAGDDGTYHAIWE